WIAGIERYLTLLGRALLASPFRRAALRAKGAAAVHAEVLGAYRSLRARQLPITILLVVLGIVAATAAALASLPQEVPYTSAFAFVLAASARPRPRDRTRRHGSARVLGVSRVRKCCTRRRAHSPTERESRTWCRQRHCTRGCGRHDRRLKRRGDLLDVRVRIAESEEEHVQYGRDRGELQHPNRDGAGPGESGTVRGGR